MIVRQVFFITAAIAILGTAVLAFFEPTWLTLYYIIIPLTLIGIMDICSTHNVRRNYPVIGHLRYMFEFIRPEIQQYFVATNLSGRPYNRESRSMVYARAKNMTDAHPFGTEHDITKPGYYFAQHAIATANITEGHDRVTIGGQACTKPYSSSIINISGMSFGAISGRAIEALNLGAKLANMAQDTGEGGISKYHLKHNGDLIFQIGTGNFGCRNAEGHFDLKLYTQQAQQEQVKMIEIKISQGAKPSHGGWLPGPKVDAEIAKTRGIDIGVDCHSPAGHSTFSTPLELVNFIQLLRNHAEGKPVGFKLCVGLKHEFMGICKAMIATGIKPDFITIDGAEGGTGAAPLEFSNRLGMPGDEGLNFVHNCLVGCNLRDEIMLITSGKVVSAFDMIRKMALGADVCHIARGMLFSIGCIQAMKCHTNLCPTGVTTQDKYRQKAIVVPQKAEQVKTYHQATIKDTMELIAGMGIASPKDLRPHHIHCRIDFSHSASLAELYQHLTPGELLGKKLHPYYEQAWLNAHAERF